MSVCNHYLRKCGLLMLSGKDCAEFLNRMTTNQVTDIESDKCLTTVLVTDKGRIIDLLSLFRSGNSILCVTSSSYRDKVAEYLNRYIIMDDVSIDFPEEDFSEILVWGDGAKPAIEEARSRFCGLSSETPLTQNVVLNENGPGIVCRIYCTSDKTKEVLEFLDKCTIANDEEYQEFRIDNCIPEAEGELNEEINPLECGLGRFISFTKGCYVGQEVIARMDSQSKIPKQMVKILSDELIEQGMKIFDNEDKESGFVSSVCNTGDGFIGLGFIRSVQLSFESGYSIEREGKKHIIRIKKIIDLK